MIMDNVDLQILRQVALWQEQGHAVVLCTVTRTWGSAPRPVGSLVALRDDGRLAGSVSGGCIEDDLIARLRSGDGRPAKPERISYGVSSDEAARFGLPCGGTLELMLEPLHAGSRIAELLARLAQGERVQRVLDLASGEVTLTAAPAGAQALVLSETSLSTIHGPDWRLLIIGAGQMSHYLASMALALDYAVQVCDPREEYAQGWNVAGAQLLAGMPDDAVTELRADAHSAIVALTHDAKLDDLALMEALRSPAFYVGAIGSTRTQAKRKARLAEHFGLSEAELARLHGPVGLRIGARTPSEIAVSILAEMTAVRYGAAMPVVSKA
jgi:xanthine dehydrogenase accessory factor